MTRIHILLQTHEKDGYLMSYSPPFSPPPPPQQPPQTINPSPSGSKISPAVLFIIVILAVLFFISGLLHLLVRFLIKSPNPHSSSSSSSSSSPSRPQEFSTSDALQRQLQQLFHLHDSGLDQSFIDSLPVFHYREIVGPRKIVEPFDCAVCLCEFSDKDKLRLLPLCGHAFHIGCIDTWLLSNSTCPLCRSALFSPPGFSVENPVFDLRDDDDVAAAAGRKMGVGIEEADVAAAAAEPKGALPVRLGKFRRVDRAEAGEVSVGGESSRLDSRRCFSMGSYEYVLGDSALRVVTRPNREASDSNNVVVGDDLEGKKMSKGESFSVSKIWLWSRKGKFSTSSEAGSNSGMASSLNVDLPWMGKN